MNWCGALGPGINPVHVRTCAADIEAFRCGLPRPSSRLDARFLSKVHRAVSGDRRVIRETFGHLTAMLRLGEIPSVRNM